MDTSKDAIKLLNVASGFKVYNGDFASERMQRVEAFVVMALQLAQKRMSRPAVVDSEGRHIHVAKPISNVAMAYTSVKSTSFLPRELSPIFIDLIPLEEESNDDDAFDIECAIVLYNFGLAHHILAKMMIQSSESARVQSSLQESAFSFLDLAHALLSKINEFNQQAVFLDVLLTRALIRCCHELGRSADEYHRAFTRLYTIVRGQHEFLPLQYESRAAAAA